MNHLLLPFRYFILTLITLLPLFSYAQQQVTGQVLHAQTRQALDGVTITANTGEQTLTTASGRFALDVSDRATFLFDIPHRL
jgi:iron complex outermembrane recepter protein